MLRTIFAVGALTLLGIFALKFVFGIMGGLVAFAIWLLIVAVKILIVGLIVYFVIKLVSPDTAARLRERWGGWRA
ncbi:MAG TPA: hypothetical protein VFK13_11290 [Gemmatimonadaceae bacterium]|nr:hypothetical protein [Gemmatimonadaceae bacterium]